MYEVRNEERRRLGFQSQTPVKTKSYLIKLAPSLAIALVSLNLDTK